MIAFGSKLGVVTVKNDLPSPRRRYLPPRRAPPMPGAWSALRPELATPRGANGDGGVPRRPQSAGQIPNRSGVIARPSSTNTSRRRNQQQSSLPAEQLWQQAEHSINAEAGYPHPQPLYPTPHPTQPPTPQQQPPPQQHTPSSPPTPPSSLRPPAPHSRLVAAPSTRPEPPPACASLGGRPQAPSEPPDGPTPASNA